MTGTVITAGDVNAVAADGELRYLCVAGEELIRRIYFTVRYGDWNTAVGSLVSSTVARTANGGLRLESVVDYNAPGLQYTAVIKCEIDPAGSCRFTVKGHGGAAAENIRRCGICILLDPETYRGARFALDRAQGSSHHGRMSDIIEKDVLPAHFTSMRTTSVSGTRVRLSMYGAEFGLEDQRGFNDSSWKLYSGLQYDYPLVLAGDERSASVEVTWQQRRQRGLRQRPSFDRDDSYQGSRLPRVLVSLAQHPATFFVTSISTNPQQWGFTPRVNLDDDAAIIENARTLFYQANTARRALRRRTTAALRVDPISLEPPQERPGGRRQEGTLLASVFVLLTLKYLALGRVEEAVFGIGDGPPRAVLTALAPFRGNPISRVDGIAEAPQLLDGFVISALEGSELWLGHLWNAPTATELWLPSLKQVTVERLDRLGRWRKATVESAGARAIRIRSNGYGVTRVRVGTHALRVPAAAATSHILGREHADVR